MAFFRNRTVNLLNLHYAIHAVAMTGGGAFYCVFLLKAGVPAPGVLAAMAAILSLRFVIRPAVVPLCVRLGMKPVIVAGTLMAASQYLIMPFVHGVDRMLALLVLASAAADTVYWSSYHAYFAALGDPEHRGHQTSLRESVTAVVGIASPLATGWVLVQFGPFAAFGATAAMQGLSAVPLLWTPQVRVAAHVPGAFRAALPGVKLFLADGWIQSGLVFVWTMALFLSLGQSFLNFGGALAVAALAGAIAGLFLGRHIDAGGGGRAVVVALGGLVIVTLARAGSFGHPVLAVIANALASVSSCLYVPTMMTAVYNQAKRAPCTLRFHVATEGGWDVGGALGSLAAALMLWLEVRLSLVLILPLLGIAASFVQLWRYYARNSQESSIAV